MYLLDIYLYIDFGEKMSIQTLLPFLIFVVIIGTLYMSHAIPLYLICNYFSYSLKLKHCLFKSESIY